MLKMLINILLGEYTVVTVDDCICYVPKDQSIKVVASRFFEQAYKLNF